MVRWAVGVFKTGLEEGIHVPGVEFHFCQRIGRVMHLTAAKAARRLGEQQVAFGEEEFEGAGFSEACLRIQPVAKTRRGFASALAMVVDPTIGLWRGHASMMVG